MLVLTRRLDESLVIWNDIKTTVVNIDRTQIKLGIEVPKDVIINRDEVHSQEVREGIVI